MRSRIAGQVADMHPDSVLCQTQEPSHRRAGKMRSAGRGIDSRADTRAHDAAPAIDKIAIDTGMMIRVFFQNAQVAFWGAMTAFARRNWLVGHDVLADHEIGALLGKRDDNVCVVARRLFQQALIHF